MKTSVINGKIMYENIIWKIDRSVSVVENFVEPRENEISVFIFESKGKFGIIIIADDKLVWLQLVVSAKYFW